MVRVSEKPENIIIIIIYIAHIDGGAFELFYMRSLTTMYTTGAPRA